MESSSSFKYSRDGVEFRAATIEVAGTFTVIDERTGAFVAQALEIRDNGEGELPHISIRDVGFSVDLETREVIRKDGKSVRAAVGKAIQSVVGNPSVRELREDILAEKKIIIGQWLDIPVSVFNKSHYIKLGFAGARYQIVSVSGPVVEWHLQVSGDDGTIDLFETLSIETLRATKGRAQGALERKIDGKSTRFVFEASYQTSAL